ncbi:MAG: hypothetical protein D6712_07765 [Chloroflexi bacterium]|nr:MAG: hypothetical protein D6712_07765 [Chloroflexota bacterium]
MYLTGVVKANIPHKNIMYVRTSCGDVFVPYAIAPSSVADSPKGTWVLLKVIKNRHPNAPYRATHAWLISSVAAHGAYCVGKAPILFYVGAANDGTPVFDETTGREFYDPDVNPTEAIFNGRRVAVTKQAFHGTTYYIVNGTDDAIEYKYGVARPIKVQNIGRDTTPPMPDFILARYGHINLARQEETRKLFEAKGINVKVVTQLRHSDGAPDLPPYVFPDYRYDGDTDWLKGDGLARWRQAAQHMATKDDTVLYAAFIDSLVRQYYPSTPIVLVLTGEAALAEFEEYLRRRARQRGEFRVVDSARDICPKINLPYYWGC